MNQSVDNVVCLRSMFLRSGVEDALAIMNPVLLSSRNDLSTFSSMPAETLALWSDALVVSDVFDRIFVWKGREVAGVDSEEHEPLQGRLRAIVAQRYPTPTVLYCTEGSSMARFVISRLCPSHHDTPEEQLASFPALHDLSVEARSALSKKLIRTDTASFRNWLRYVCFSKGGSDG